MSSSTHRIELIAHDGTKQVFDAIKRGAAEDARALDEMGRTGSRALKDVEKAAQDVDKGMERAGRSIGLAMLALGTSFAFAARSSQDQARQLDAINRLYGESADEILKLSEAIQDNTNFSNDAARQAAITGSTLAQNYQLSAEQIGVLIERSADLAAIHGIDLADAMSRVAGAIRGEGEAAELLGLNMSDSAVAAAAAAAGLTGWTTTMTEAEKAAFRYSLVLEQTTATQGAAADAAEGTRGTMIDLRDSVQDAAQRFAAWTGPIGEATAALSDNALEIALLGGGAIKAVQGINQLIAAQRAAAAAAAATGAASTGLTAALGPIGLVAAAGVAAFAIYELTKGHDEEAEAAKEAAAASKDLATVLRDLAAAGDPTSGTAVAWAEAMTQGLGGVAEQIQAIRDEMTALSGTDQPVAIDPNAVDESSLKLAELERQLESLLAASERAGEAQIALANIFRNTGVGADLAEQAAADLFDQFSRDGDIVKLTEGIIRVGTHLGDFDITANEAAAAARQLALDSAGAADAFDVIGKAIADLGIGLADTAKGQKILSDLQVVAAEGTEEQRASLQKLWAEAQTSDRAFASFAATLHLTASVLRDQAAAIDATTAAFARATDRQAAYQEQLAGNMAAAVKETARDFEQAYDRQSAAQDAFAANVAAADADRDRARQTYWEREAQRQDAYQAGLGESIAAAEEAASAQDEINKRIVKIDMDETVPMQMAKATLEYANALGVLDSVAEKLRPIDISVSGGDKVTGTAANAERAAGAFAASTGVIIRQTDAIGNSIEAVGKWSAAMLPAEDEIGTLNDLLDRGIISYDQYAQATKYAGQITEDNARAQDSLAKIQARQVPFIEQQTEAYADQLAAIAAMPPEMARVTLGFMDATEAGKAQEAVMLAAAAAAGELGENGQAAATQIIEGAVAADPILGAMLESIGLVARDHEGNLVVNFPEGESLNELVKNLDQSIKTLTTALIILDGTSANPGVSVAGVVESLGDISSVSSALAALDGQSANTSINNVTTNVTNNITREIKEAVPLAHGGMVGAASGRMIRANEGGRETATLPTGDDVWLPTGSMVWPYAASAARGGGRGGGRTFNNYGSVTIVANNPAEFWDQMSAYGLSGR